MQELAVIEPIPAATEKNPTPSLPVWVRGRENVLRQNVQLDPSTGKWIEPLTLPANQMLTDPQRAEIERHRQSLTSLLNAPTPSQSEVVLAQFGAMITKLMLAKPSPGGSNAAEARMEAYETALEDLPLWAVWASIRRWYRAEAGKDERGRSYDYTWAPDCAVLKQLAEMEYLAVQARLRKLDGVLAAVPFIDCSEQLERGASAWRGLKKLFAKKAVQKETTMDDCVRLDAGEPA